MAKKNFKGGLDSLIENSLGIKKSRKGEMKGNPVDFIKPEQTDDDDEVLAKPRTPKKPVQQPAAAQPAVATPEKAATPAAPAPKAAETQADATMEAFNIEDSDLENNKTEAPQQPEQPQQAAEQPQQPEQPQQVAEQPQQPEQPQQVAEQPQQPEQPQQSTEQPQQPAPEPIKVNLESSDDDSTTVAYLKEVIADLRHELFLWRNGSINVQTFNATLHTHGLKYNPVNNEIEEFDSI